MEIKQFLVFHLIFDQQNQILDLENLSKLILKTAPVWKVQRQRGY